MTSRKVAYLTMADPLDFVMDYELGIAPMQARGWQVDTVVWRDPAIDWDAYAAVYICTPWDYPEHVREFVEVLERIDHSSARLVNDIALVRWTLAKTYLRDLEGRGAAVVPSLWPRRFVASEMPSWFTSLGTDRLVIKPLVGANAQDTFVFENPVAADTRQKLETVFSRKPFFVQAFIESIRTEGEYSAFFFAGRFSHAIRKTPKPGDFRVQEEHGAAIERVDATPALIAAAAAVLERVEPQPLYARVDLVRADNGDLLLMELELIEPSLYLRMDDQAATRFAEAFDRYLGAEEHV